MSYKWTTHVIRVILNFNDISVLVCIMSIAQKLHN